MIEEKTPKREPVEWVCENGEACKHGWWCTEVYCQEYCHFRNTQPMQERFAKHFGVEE